MSDCSTALQTVAALASAVAAIAALWVASRAFFFQRSSLLKSAVVEQIVTTTKQLYGFRLLTSKPIFGVADEEVSGLPQRISELKNSVSLLEAMVCARARKDMEKVHVIVNGLHESSIFPAHEGVSNAPLDAKLAEAMDALQRVYRTEMK
jgi:hypothetical protein